MILTLRFTITECYDGELTFGKKDKNNFLEWHFKESDKNKVIVPREVKPHFLTLPEDVILFLFDRAEIEINLSAHTATMVNSV